MLSSPTASRTSSRSSSVASNQRRQSGGTPRVGTDGGGGVPLMESLRSILDGF
jgi:hypothetical protein